MSSFVDILCHLQTHLVWSFHRLASVDTTRFGGLMVGFGSSTILLALLGFFGAQPIVLLGIMVVLGFTSMMAIPTIPARLTEMAPEGPTLVGAVNMAAFNLANAIGAAAGGAAVGAELGLLSPAWAGLCLTTVGLAILGIAFAVPTARLRFAKAS